MKYDGLIFDLDGTMWDSGEGICGTWAEVIKKYPEVKSTVTLDKLHACMGLPIETIGQRLFPELDAKMQKKLMDECCDMENEYLAVHGGILYPELNDVLLELSEKYKLFVVSNCQKGYIESFFKAHDTGKYFTDIECYGNTMLSKGENNRLIIERNDLKNAVYIGDTQGDADSAEFAGIPFVYAEYGFGKVKKYDYMISSFAQLRELFL